MANKRAMDLTQGRPIKQILLFSLPLVMGTLFQQLYSFVDTVMVGRLISEDALAAVGTTYSLNFLTLGFVQGACVGFGIPLAQSTGAKEPAEFKRYFWNGTWLCVLLGAVMTVLTFLLAEPLLRLINTPEDIWPTPPPTFRSSSWASPLPSFIISAQAHCGRREIPSGRPTFCWPLPA